MFYTLQYTTNATIIGENGNISHHKMFAGQPIPKERLFYQDKEYAVIAYGHLHYDGQYKYLAVVKSDNIK